jgi:hypothetical protein
MHNETGPATDAFEIHSSPELNYLHRCAHIHTNIHTTLFHPTKAYLQGRISHNSRQTVREFEMTFKHVGYTSCKWKTVKYELEIMWKHACAA